MHFAVHMLVAQECGPITIGFYALHRLGASRRMASTLTYLRYLTGSRGQRQAFHITSEEEPRARVRVIECSLLWPVLLLMSPFLLRVRIMLQTSPCIMLLSQMWLSSLLQQLLVVWLVWLLSLLLDCFFNIQGFRSSYPRNGKNNAGD